MNLFYVLSSTPVQQIKLSTLARWFQRGQIISNNTTKLIWDPCKVTNMLTVWNTETWLWSNLNIYENHSQRYHFTSLWSDIFNAKLSPKSLEFVCFETIIVIHPYTCMPSLMKGGKLTDSFHFGRYDSQFHGLQPMYTPGWCSIQSWRQPFWGHCTLYDIISLIGTQCGNIAYLYILGTTYIFWSIVTPSVTIRWYAVMSDFLCTSVRR